VAVALWQKQIPNPRIRRVIGPALILISLGIIGAITLGDSVPTWLDAHVKPTFDDFYDWTVRNNLKHWLFTRILSPIADAVTWSVDGVLWMFRNLRWPGVLSLTALIGARTGGLRAAIAGVACMAACGVLGFWDETLVTLSLMLVSVVIALVIGVPLGIWAGVSEKADRRMRGLLDTTQVLPTFVYLLPAVVLLGIKEPSAVLVTVIFAIAPAVRLTSLGIRNVPVVATEVGESFGCTPRQLLLKIRIPMARRTILLGMNQVIMMAFGVVVIASLVGIAGLGGLVLKGLQKNKVGSAAGPGLALVFLAIALDRITTGERRRGGRSTTWSRLSERFSRFEGPKAWLLPLATFAGLAVVVVVSHLLKLGDFPTRPRLDIAKPVNDATKWITDNFRRDVPIIGGTSSISDFIVIHLLNPIRDLLLAPSWWIVVLIVAAIGWMSGHWRLGLMVGTCMAAIAALRVWDLAMDTLSQVLLATVLSVLIAAPLGLLAGRSNVVNTVLRPLLDAAQVLPQFVYLIPMIALFNPGRTGGIVASVIYAVPPGIRLISLGLREVPFAPREAAIAFGATPRQEMIKVQIPLALRSIMLGINQTILMVLAMVVIAGLIGGGALGLETIYGVTKSEIGQGVAGGAAIVLLAIVLDRLTQAWGSERKPAPRIAELTLSAP
jgi:glycine betaine/proline transport system permease protein